MNDLMTKQVQHFHALYIYTIIVIHRSKYYKNCSFSLNRSRSGSETDQNKAKLETQKSQKGKIIFIFPSFVFQVLLCTLS